MWYSLRCFSGRFLKGPAALLVLALQWVPARADITSLGLEWGEGMVLQSGIRAPINGDARAGDQVTITFRSRSYEGRADPFGKWKIEVEPGAAGGPFDMTITGGKIIALKNVHVADLKLAPIIGNGMVLQRGDRAPIFGTTVPQAKVSVTFRGKNHETWADARGAWRVDLIPGDAGGPFNLAIAGKTTTVLDDVYVGDVWVCSGQSNMRWGVSYTQDAGRIADQINPLLRLQRFPETNYALDRPPMQYGAWRAADRKAVLAFSGTGYFFGAALQEKLQVPVGLIQAAVDATSIRQWLPGDKSKELKLGSATDGDCYARSIRTLQPFAIRGVIWYQGESDAVKDGFDVGYHRRLAALIEGWRRDWDQGDFPFLYVQLPRIGFGAAQVHNGQLPTAEQKEIVGEWARIRDEQRQVLGMVPNVGMVVYYEHTTGMLHPPQRRHAGGRLALAARRLVYDEKVEFSGPLFDSARRMGDEVLLRFSHADGLTARDGPLRQVEAAGADGKFRAVQGRIDGACVRLDVAGLQGPLTIRYAHREWPDGNLVNSAGLPASPFIVHGIQ
jgi:sialate O-acetylesterase